MTVNQSVVQRQLSAIGDHVSRSTITLLAVTGSSQVFSSMFSCHVMIRSLREHMYLRPCECIGKITCRWSERIRSTIKLGQPTHGVSYRRAIFVPRTRMLYLSASWPDIYKAEVAEDADFRQLANLSLQHPGLTYLTRILRFDDLYSTLHMYSS
jgi:hypothetical protein